MQVMQPQANQVWGDPKRPETWVLFGNYPFLLIDDTDNWLTIAWGRVSDCYTDGPTGRFIHTSEAARWAADNGFVDITAIVRGAVG